MYIKNLIQQENLLTISIPLDGSSGGRAGWQFRARHFVLVHDLLLPEQNRRLQSLQRYIARLCQVLQRRFHLLHCFRRWQCHRSSSSRCLVLQPQQFIVYFHRRLEGQQCHLVHGISSVVLGKGQLNSNPRLLDTSIYSKVKIRIPENRLCAPRLMFLRSTRDCDLSCWQFAMCSLALRWTVAGHWPARERQWSLSPVEAPLASDSQ